MTSNKVNKELNQFTGVAAWTSRHSTGNPSPALASLAQAPELRARSA